jgi:hypothetical protein
MSGRVCTCAGTAPGYPQHEDWCGKPEVDEPPIRTVAEGMGVRVCAADSRLALGANLTEALTVRTDGTAFGGVAHALTDRTPHCPAAASAPRPSSSGPLTSLAAFDPPRRGEGSTNEGAGGSRLAR